MDLKNSAQLEELVDHGPGCVLIPPPPRSSYAPAWDKVLGAAFFKMRIRLGKPISFTGPLALDIALRGRAASHTDVDNVARTICRSFASVFKPERPRIDGYRVYRQVSQLDDVRVRLMPIGRQLRLARAMRDAEDVIRLEQSSRARGL